MTLEIKQSTLTIILMVLLSGLVSAAQEVDPFYLNLLAKGEKSFLNGDHKEAVKNLEIAYFGIRAKGEIKAKACVYLGISYYYLKNSAEGTKYLQEAKEILGEEGISTLDIDQSTKLEFIRLAKASELGRTVRAEGLQTLPRVPAERASQNIYNSKEDIERLIKADPRNASSYYSLYSFHRFKSDFKEAKKAIEKLVKNIPQDIYGYYMLGIILYQERKFKDAASRFSTFLQRAPAFDISKEAEIEIRAYLILSRYYHGDRQEADKLLEESREVLRIEAIPSLSLSDKDKIVLRGLLENSG